MHTVTKFIITKTKRNRLMESKMFKILVIGNKGKITFPFQSITYLKTSTLIKVNLTVQYKTKTKTIRNRKMETKTAIKITRKYQTQKYLNLNPTVLVKIKYAKG